MILHEYIFVIISIILFKTMFLSRNKMEIKVLILKQLE